MKKLFLFLLVLVPMATASQTAFAFSLKLVSVSGDRAEVLVNGMPRSFPAGFISQDGIKLVSLSSGKASFQAGGKSFSLAPGQSWSASARRNVAP